MGLPGVESVPTPRGVILRAFPGSPGPKTAKIQIFVDFGGPPSAAPPPYRVRGSPKRAVCTSSKILSSWAVLPAGVFCLGFPAWLPQSDLPSSSQLQINNLSYPGWRGQ